MDANLKDFLKNSDFETFEGSFSENGMFKIEHMQDVDEDGLKSFGFSSIQIKRFNRKLFSRKESVSDVEHSAKLKSVPKSVEMKVEMKAEMVAPDACPEVFDAKPGPSKDVKPKSFLNFTTNSKDFEPWKEKKFGWIPNATTSRAIYMNNLLPDFYKCCFKVSLNAKDFVVQFHAEGKRQYNAKQTFIELRDTFNNSIRNVKDLSSIGKNYDPEYSLGPSDIGTIKHNKDRIKQLYQKGKKLEEELIDCSKLFTNKSPSANIMILNILLDHFTLVPLSITRTGSNNCTRKERNWKKNLLNAVSYLLTSQVRSWSEQDLAVIYLLTSQVRSWSEQDLAKILE